MDQKQEYNLVRGLFDALIVGGLAGLLSTFYRFLVSKIGHFRNMLYGQKSLQSLALTIFLAIVIAIIIHLLLKWAPLSGGSGIPQIRGELMGHLDMEATPTIVSKLVGGGLGNFIGFSLGREGPSIQMGGAGGKILAGLLGRSREEKKLLITMGAAAGLAAAFNAPLAGCVFAIEEIHKSYSHKILLPALLASCMANAVSFILMGQETSFSFAAAKNLPIALAFVPIMIGFLTGLVGAIYNKLITSFQDFFGRLDKVGLAHIYKYGTLMGITLLVGFFFLDMTGGGHPLLEQMAKSDMPLKSIFVILIVKLFYTTFCYGSGVQGGIFLPVLVIGGACGALVFWILSRGMDLDIFYVNFLILGMSGILSSVVRSPLLSVILVSEMTSTYKHVWALALVVIVSYYVAQILNSQPIYDTLLDRILKKNAKRDSTKIVRK